MKNVLKLTLIIVFNENKILLGMKKRGFGVGKWNGFGGKVEKNENIFESVERELLEESGLKIKNNLIRNGKINFLFEDKMDEILEVNIFSIKSDNTVGKIKETEEMLPKWFDIDEVPYEKMWISDKDWLPLLLKGESFSGEILFRDNGNKIIKKEIIIE